MSTRIDDLPVIATRPDQIEAALYNLWRRARQRFGTRLRIELPGLKEMALLLEDDAWVVVDQRQYDLPILAWVQFAPEGRAALHEPVRCTLNYYHFMASQLRAKVLELMHENLQTRLHPGGEGK
ncbi:MAG: hypothetical protein DWQ09_09645 [Proteobacteria bacterium]|nr:MAG: hypothetical protein DWQ09_09645 [Pseudomonadota bacterium]QKK10611.1 MAG: hypothetical protein HND59_02320 [Pseudomonadota bacterium]